MGKMKVLVKVDIEMDLKTLRTLNILAGDDNEGFNEVVCDACEYYASSESVEEVLALHDLEQQLETDAFIIQTDEGNSLTEVDEEIDGIKTIQTFRTDAEVAQYFMNNLIKVLSKEE